MKQEMEENTIFPEVLCRVYNGVYSIDSRHIAGIMRLPEYNSIPDAPDTILGIIPFREKFIPLLDVRTIFGLPTLNQEYRELTEMLELRRRDHIHWVEELERCIIEGEKFTLSTDPHKCPFGIWYDHFQSNNHFINHHMRKIQEPHQKLHAAALEVECCNQKHDDCSREKCLKEVFKNVKGFYMPQILTLLEEAKSVFKSAYHEMVLVLEEETAFGIVVDEVLAVENISAVEGTNYFDLFPHSEFVSGIKKSDTVKETILELNEEKLIALAKTFSQGSLK